MDILGQILIVIAVYYLFYLIAKLIDKLEQIRHALFEIKYSINGNMDGESISGKIGRISGSFFSGNNNLYKTLERLRRDVSEIREQFESKTRK